jgi:pimeloyl-ACP methyl ester carboxylesterase
MQKVSGEHLFDWHTPKQDYSGNWKDRNLVCSKYRKAQGDALRQQRVRRNKKNSMNRIILSLSSFVLTLCSFGQDQYAIKYGDNKEAGNYKKVNGINMYYEIYGSGKPLIFLHGNGGSIFSSRAKIEYFKKYFRVIAIDSRAHGKSIDTTTQVLTYVRMADDINVLLDSLNVDSAYISGQSDGGILGLLLAINYPGKVAKLATYGANMMPGREAVFDEIDRMVMDTLKVTKDFKTKRLYNLLAFQPHITVKDLQKIKCPVLIMSGDRDVIRLEHSIKIFNNIINSNFFVMPGATHFGSYEKPELFDLVLSDFLNKPFSKASTVDKLKGSH